MLTATANYQLITQNLPRTLETTAARPDVARQTQNYLEKIGNIKSVDDLLNDYEVFSYAMKAHGLEEMSYAKAFMRKVLEEGIDKQDSFANSLSDKRYREFAETFNFSRYDTAATSFTRAQQGTVDKYLRQTVEEDAGAQDEGVRLALYFQRKAPEIDSTLEFLADPALLKVMQTVLGFSEASGALDIDRQVAMFEKRFDVEDLKDPEKLDKLLTRFTALWESQRDPGFSINNASTFLIGGGVSYGIGSDLLASIQNLRLGGS